MDRPRQWLLSMGAGIVLGAAIASAQAPESAGSAGIVSATGCLQRAAAAPNGQGSGGSFVLNGARIGGASGGQDRPAVPATSPGIPTSNEASESTNTAEPGSGAPPVEARASGNDMASVQSHDRRLPLAADPGVDLAGHVGHRVMVTGRLSSFGSPDGGTAMAPVRTLTVTKVTPIAPACTPGS